MKKKKNKLQQYAIIPKLINRLNKTLFCHQTGIWCWQPFNILTAYLYLFWNWLGACLAQASLWIIKIYKPNFRIRDVYVTVGLSDGCCCCHSLHGKESRLFNSTDYFSSSFVTEIHVYFYSLNNFSPHGLN